MYSVFLAKAPHFFPLYTVIGFGQPSYTVDESQATLNVSFTASGATEPINVTVSAMSGTAMGTS